jgi:hypothetical protein
MGFVAVSIESITDRLLSLPAALVLAITAVPVPVGFRKSIEFEREAGLLCPSGMRMEFCRPTARSPASGPGS